jgi:hypothetical protein
MLDGVTSVAGKAITRQPPHRTEVVMHKLEVLYPKPADPDHFRDYYVTNHLPLVARMPGLLAWRYSFDWVLRYPSWREGFRAWDRG